MVRLKVQSDVRSQTLVIIFQFHYGTIKSGTAGSAFLSFGYFNSTMVRLKELMGTNR